MSDRLNTNCNQIDMDILPYAVGVIVTNFGNAYVPLSPPPQIKNVVLHYLLLFYIMVFMLHEAADFHCPQSKYCVRRYKL